MKCSECGAVWLDGNTCQDYFHQMLFWENENPEYGEVHHLMVLSFHLQHPGLLSLEGLQEAADLLIEFLERGSTPRQVRNSRRSKVSSGKRDWKIIATGASKGAYSRPIQWAMTAANVVAEGRENYCANVRRWAENIYEALNDVHSSPGLTAY
jgi:hypothetical protein